MIQVSESTGELQGFIGWRDKVVVYKDWTSRRLLERLRLS